MPAKPEQSGVFQRPHGAQPAPDFPFGGFQIVSRLQIESVLRRLRKSAAEKQR